MHRKKTILTAFFLHRCDSIKDIYVYMAPTLCLNFASNVDQICQTVCKMYTNDAFMHSFAMTPINRIWMSISYRKSSESQFKWYGLWYLFQYTFWIPHLNNQQKETGKFDVQNLLYNIYRWSSLNSPIPFLNDFKPDFDPLCYNDRAGKK